MRQFRRDNFCYLLLLCAACCDIGLAQSKETLQRLEAPFPVRTFTDSVGVNVHINYFDRLYGNFDLVKDKLVKLSIRHVRDGVQLISDDYDSLMYGRWVELQKAGIKFNAVVDPRGSIKYPDAAHLVQVLDRAHGSIESFEGPNELDISGLSGWPSVILTYQSSLFSTMRSTESLRQLSTIAPSFASISNGFKTAHLAAKADFGNLHAYPAGEMPSNVFPDQSDKAKQVFGNLPVVMTETGYHNALRDKHDQPAVTEGAAAKYIPRIYLENFLHRIVRTYLYELLDEAPNEQLDDNQLHWGLIRSDGTEKPAFRSLANLMDLLNDSGIAKKRIDVSVSISGDLKDIHSLFLVKQDGTYCLILWQEVSSYETAKARNLISVDRPLALAFSAPSSGSLIYPLTGNSPKSVFARKTRIKLQVPDHALVVLFKPLH
jgi:hypothetical protein